MEPGEQSDTSQKTYGKLVGGSYVIFVEPESPLVNVLGLDRLKQADGPDKMPFAEKEKEGKYGEYGAIWNPQKQRGDT